MRRNFSAKGARLYSAVKGCVKSAYALLFPISVRDALTLWSSLTKLWMDAEERFAPAQVHEIRHGDRLVYTWHQSVSSVYVQVPAPGMRAKDVVCQFSSRALVLGLKGNAPYMQVLVSPPALSDFSA
jgi:hypothetical protein